MSEPLVLAPARAMGPDGLIFELSADGTVVAQGQAVGTLSAEGTLTTSDGERVADLVDGRLSIGGRAAARIEGGVAILEGFDGDDLRLEFGDDGLLRSSRGPDNDMFVRIEPADSPASLAMLVLVVVLMI